jgi:hypothetical protein
MRSAVMAPVALAAALLASAALLELAPYPFAWIGLVWAAVLFWMAWRRPGRTSRLVLFNLAFVPLTFGGFELYLGVRPQPYANPDIPDAYKLRDEVVGHKIAAGVSVRHALWLGAEPIFDAVYTIGADGLRIVPAPWNEGDGACVIFFVDSFVFGWGLNDDETMPWMVAQLTGRRHRIYNLSYLAWGPHHMLSMLQSGRVEELVDCAPTHVLYSSIYDHVHRAAGRSPNDLFGPRFELRQDGVLEQRGSFDDQPRFTRRWPRLAKSGVVRALAEDFDPGPADFERFAAIVAASRDLLEARWPGVRFDVLLWDRRWRQDAAFWESLERRRITVHFVSEILPGQREEPQRYVLGPHDGHPNAHANERIARWFVKEILGEEGAGSL